MSTTEAPPIQVSGLEPPVPQPAAPAEPPLEGASAAPERPLSPGAAVIAEQKAKAEAAKAALAAPPAVPPAGADADGTTVEITMPGGKTATTTLDRLERAAQSDPGGSELFDTSAYQTPRPQVDGMTTDTLVIKVSGTHTLDPMIEDDVRMFERFHLGDSVELRVSGLVVAFDGKLKRNADDEDTVTGMIGIKIDHLYRLEPEEL